MIDEKRIKLGQIVYETDDEMDAHTELYVKQQAGEKNLAVAEVARMKKRPPTSAKYIVFRVIQD